MTGVVFDMRGALLSEEILARLGSFAPVGGVALSADKVHLAVVRPGRRSVFQVVTQTMLRVPAWAEAARGWFAAHGVRQVAGDRFYLGSLLELKQQGLVIQPLGGGSVSLSPPYLRVLAMEARGRLIASPELKAILKRQPWGISPQGLRWPVGGDVEDRTTLRAVLFAVSAMSQCGLTAHTRRLRKEAHGVVSSLGMAGAALVKTVGAVVDLCLHLAQEGVDILCRKARQQGDDQTGQGVDVDVLAEADRVGCVHPDLSSVWRRGEDAESPAGETRPAVKPGAAQ